MLLIPEDADAIPRRHLIRQPEARHRPVTRAPGRATQVRLVGPLRGIADVLVRIHAGDRSIGALVAKVREEPEPVLRDRSAQSEVVVPQRLDVARLRQATVDQLRRQIVPDHPVDDVGDERGPLERVAAGAWHDVDGGPADRALAQAARARGGDFLRIPHVDVVAAGAAAGGGRSDAEPIDLDTAFIGAAAGPAEELPPGRRSGRPCSRWR